MIAASTLAGYLAAITPLMVTPGAGHDVTGQLVVLGALFVAVQLIVDVSLAAGQAG